MHRFKSILLSLFFLFVLSCFFLSSLSSEESEEESKKESKEESKEGPKEESKREDLGYVPGQVIIKLREKSEEGFSGSGSLGKISSEQSVQVVHSFQGIGLHSVASKVGQNVEELVEELNQHPDVLYAEPDYYLYSIPREERILSQSEVDRLIEEKKEEELATDEGDGELSQYDTSDVPIVAVIDSGVDMSQDGFIKAKALWKNEQEIPDNNIDDDNNGYVDDYNGWDFLSNSDNIIDDDGHGTHVAGVVLRTHLGLYNRFFQFPELQNPRVQIMNLKYSDYNTKGTVSRASRSIYYAANNGAKVINASWGGYYYSRTLHEAVVYAYKKGVVFVASAGNDGAENNENNPIYPSDLDVPSLISVAALNVSFHEFVDLNPNADILQKKKQLALFSNYSVDRVHVAAPGVNVLSAFSSSVNCPGNNCTYAVMSGTSMAAPVVSGLASLLFSIKSNFLGFQVKSIILDEATEIESLRSRLITGSQVNIRGIVGWNKDVVVDNSQPYYHLREPASAGKERGLPEGEDGAIVGEDILDQLTGCGMIQPFLDKMGSKGGRGGSSRNLFFVFLTLSLISLPFLTFHLLYRRANNRRKRKHERFQMRSDVRITSGEREFVGSLRTISLGGAQIDTQALFEKGGVVSMKIKSEDGKEQIDVEGKIVWEEATKSVGVQFVGTKEEALARISSWSRALEKS